MASDLITEAIRNYHANGLFDTVHAGIQLGIRNILISRFMLEQDADIFEAASSIIPISEGADFEISYSGSENEPHPAHIPFVTGAARATPRVVCDFRDVRVIGTRPIIEVDGTFVSPSSIGTGQPSRGYGKSRIAVQEAVPIRKLFRKNRPNNSKETRVESAFLLSGYFLIFGHWTFEILPKLRAYEGYCTRTGEEPTIITVGELTNWQRESLLLLGYDPEDLLQAGRQPIAVDQLLVPSHRYLTWTHVPTFPSPNDIRWVSERMKENLPEDGDGGNSDTRLFISREDAPRRHVENRTELVSALEPFDFTPYEPGRLSFADQVRLFANAEIILGAYGAGLSNLVFFDDATVVELVNGERNNIHHFVLANLCDQAYEYIHCAPVPTKGTAPRNYDMRAPIETVVDVVESIV